MNVLRVVLQKSPFCSSLFIIFLGVIAVRGVSAQDAAPPKPAPAPSVWSARATKKSLNAENTEKTAPNEANTETTAGEGKVLDEDADQDWLDDIVKRAEWFYHQRSSVNGRIPAGARMKAVEHLQNMMVAEGKLKQRVDGTYAQVMPEAGTSSTPVWASIGPTPTVGSSFGPVTGRITTIAVDPSDSTGSTVLIGGAQGGIWRTTNGGTTWAAVGDQNASLAMGSIAFAPSQPATVYAGTGEQASIGFDVYYGAGVLISTDSGQTWRQTCIVASTTCPFIGPYDDVTAFGYFTLGGTRISYVAVNPTNPNMVLVGAQTQFTEGATEGVYCSDNRGVTWTNILPDEMSTFVGFASSSVAFAALGNPFGSSSGATNGNGIYKATAIGSTCATIQLTRLLSTSLPLQSTMGRIDLGIAPSVPSGNTVYASISDATTGSQMNLGIYTSLDGGTSWTKTNAIGICQPQCWYDNVVKVDPNNPQYAFFGGGAVTVSGAPSWVTRTTNGGASWSPAIPAVSPPHVDTHAMAFVKLSTGKVRMYLGNDGGIWRTDDAEAATVTWTNLNDSTLTLSQFYPAISIHPSSPAIAVGGTQDNGTQTYSGTPSWANVNVCGDGTGTAIDAQIPSTVYIACNGDFLYASYQNGAAGTFSFAANGINISDNSSFVPPFVVDPEQPGVAYLGTVTVYQSLDAANTWTPIASNLVNGANTEALTALAVAPTNSKSLYAGATTGQIFATSDVTSGTGMAAVPGQSSLPPRAVTAIAVDPADATGQTAYAAFSGFSFVSNAAGFIVNDPTGHIFKTTDRGSTWKDASCSVPATSNCMTPGPTDLPNLPVNDLVMDPDLPGTIYAATDLGVYVGNCGAIPCTWSTLGTGLPRVAVLSLKLHEPSRTLRAATHGRGVWDIVLNNFAFPAGPHLTALSPTSAKTGVGPLTLTVTGSGLSGGNILFGSAQLAATGTASDTSLSATIPTNLLVTGVPVVTVNSASGTSNGLKFVVVGGAPAITAIAPSSTPAQANPVTGVPVTLTGTNFVSGSKVLWNGAPAGITVQGNSATSITATLPGALLGPYGSTDSVSVVNAPPGGGQSAAFAFKVAGAVPSNDNFGNALNIGAATFTDDKDSSSATTESSDPIPPCATQYTSAQGNTGGHANGAYNTIWYKFTPTFSSNLSVDTIGSNYDTVLSIWTGAQGSLVNVACNDDITAGTVVQSQLQNVTLTAGTTYYILVSAFGPPDPNPIGLGGHAHLDFSYNNGGNPVPTVTTVSPSTAVSGGPGFTLTVNGTNFLSGAIVFFNNVGKTATYVSAKQLTATVNAADILFPARTSVFVSNPPPAGGASNNVNFTITLGTYPVPTLTSVVPNSLVANSLGNGLTIFGTNFAPTATVNINGTPIPTTYLQSTNLTATVPQSVIATAGTVQATVVNPSPGGGPSNALPITVTAPAIIPTIASLSPSSSPEGTSPMVTITGTGFQLGATVNFNNSFYPGTLNGSTQMTVSLPLTAVAPGTYSLYVSDPAPAGASLPANFTVTAPAIIPTIASLRPSSSPEGTSPTVTITGTAFQAGATVNFNGSVYPGTLNGSTQMTVSLPLTSVAPGTYALYVSDPAPAGRSSTANFVVTAPNTPSITVSDTAVTLSSATGASQTSTITVTPAGGFTGTVTLGCPAASSLPAGVSCTAPGGINITGATPVTGNVTVAVAATSATLHASGERRERSLEVAGATPSRAEKGWRRAGAGLGFAAVLLLLLPGRKRYRAALGLSLLCMISLTLGCAGGGGAGGGGGGGGQTATSTTITVAAAKVASGSPFAFTVTVTGGTPGAQVQLLEKGAAVATASLAGGSASLTTGSLTVGTHSISARYAGDANTQTSSSGVLNVTVTGTTSVAITTNPAATPSVAPITLTIN